jgi:UDP-N-acetylmuramate dehydrogenase
LGREIGTHKSLRIGVKTLPALLLASPALRAGAPSGLRLASHGETPRFFPFWRFAITPLLKGRFYLLEKMKIEVILPGIKRNVSLKDHTTFKIGGRAKYFFEAKEKRDLIRAVFLAKKLRLPYFILGGGSNVLVSDKDFEGLVIKTSNKKWAVLNNEIYAEAGAKLAKIVEMAAKNDLSGFEFAIGIPGTIGGAIFGNCGAFGKSIGNLVKEVEIFDLKSNCLKVLRKIVIFLIETAFSKKTKI